MSHHKSVSQDSSHGQLSYVNFYQYPPPKLVAATDQLSLAEKLALDQIMPRERLFTIFVSIPYCRSRCHSCRFFKGLLPPHVDRNALMNDYLDCLDAQIQKYATTTRFSSARCGAVYFGGGTASLLSPDQANRLVHTIKQSFTINQGVEITLEGNPRDFSLEYLQKVREGGINRISIGLQSTQDRILKKMLNCPHDSRTGLNAVRDALSVGFNTVNIDMLYQVPGQTSLDWQHDIKAVLDLQTEGITVYQYMTYPDSASEQLIANGRLPKPVDIDTAYEWYLWAKGHFHEYGYIEQRKGLFCKPSHEQKYGQLSYTEGYEIVGLGAGAYSFINGYQFNAPDEAELFKDQVRGGLFLPVIKLSSQATNQNLMERHIIFSFFGFSLNRQEFFHRFGQDPVSVFPSIFSKLEQQGLIIVNEEQISITELGKKWRSNILYEFYSQSFK